MTELHPSATRHKSLQNSFTPTPPILVSVKEARRLLGGMNNLTFWEKAMAGEFGDVVGSERKRLLYFENIKRYADSLPRAPYSKKSEEVTA